MCNFIFPPAFATAANGHNYVTATPQGFGNMPDHRRHATTTQPQQYFTDYTNSVASSTPVTTDTQTHEYDHHHINGGKLVDIFTPNSHKSVVAETLIEI